MNQRFEYRFIRLDKNARAAKYQAVVREQAAEGWRLVQIFAPGAGGIWGKENFCEVILERDAH
jgi:hypothetical protein